MSLGLDMAMVIPIARATRCEMPVIDRIPPSIWRLLRYLPPRLAYSVGLGSIAGRFVLLLTTVGRRSGLPRVTPLLYDEIEGIVYVGSARGTKADWYQNLQANPKVEVNIGSRRFTGYAELITEPGRVAAFLERRLRLHPIVAALAMRLEGLCARPSHAQLEEYAKRRALVAIKPG